MLESQYRHAIRHNTKHPYTCVLFKNFMFINFHIQRQSLVTKYSTLIYITLCFCSYTNVFWNSKTLNSCKTCQMIHKTTFMWNLIKITLILNIMTAPWNISGRASYIFSIYFASLACGICHLITNPVNTLYKYGDKLHIARGQINVHNPKYSKYVYMISLIQIEYLSNCQCKIWVQYYNDIYTYSQVHNVLQETYICHISLRNS